MIRFFDIDTHKQVKSIVAHTDAVTSLIIPNKKLVASNTFVSGGHDGAVRAWDLRTF